MNFCARNALLQRREGSGMIEMRRAQLGFGGGLIAEEVSRSSRRLDDCGAGG